MTEILPPPSHAALWDTRSVHQELVAGACRQKKKKQQQQQQQTETKVAASVLEKKNHQKYTKGETERFLITLNETETQKVQKNAF